MIDDYTSLWVAPINDVGLPARAAEQEGLHALAELAEARDILTPDPAINPKAVLRQIAWRKYEQARQEIYIYDLAVHEKWRRRGIASQLIENIKSIAQNMGAYSIIVQAYPEDHAAIALYRQSSSPENILTFDIEIAKTAPLK